MSQDLSLDDLMARLRKGDNEAASRVFNRFAGQLIELARKRLNARVRRKIDPEDVLQSVFRSFFAHHAAGDLGEFPTWDSVWGILLVITMRKCGRRLQYFARECRDVRREVTCPAPDDSSASYWEAPAAEPTPAEAALLTDLIDHVMNGLEGRHRDILALSLQGYTAEEISGEVGCTERQVFRVLERVKRMLKNLAPATTKPSRRADSSPPFRGAVPTTRALR